jgi:hypothetical protein
MAWLYVLYAAIGIFVYYQLAKAIERQTGQAPQMGCIMWILICLAWPLIVVGLVISLVRARGKP